ncbi:MULTISPECIES: Fe-S protein [unclassified Microbacterium]|uniref:Fe-S protein n=1 Tax=unclassified Microbacterium TaxID=2609290 RepID=UPI0012FC8E45|nr:Fe-S protein [Microbacterium sp. MAH-37]MVQ42031.1 Fe-S protein [Microbacterium sp. MAH-37]
METLRAVVVFVHLLGFAVLFGAWAAQAFGGKRQFTQLMNVGLAIAGVAGLALAAPWGIEWTPGMSFYIKITVKLVVLIIIGGLIGMGMAKQKRGEAVPAGAFWAVGVLALLNAALGFFWH